MMATLTIELSDDLMSKIAKTGRSAQDVIVDSLQKTLISESASTNKETSREEIIQHLVEAGLVREPGTWDSPEAKAWRDLSEEEKQRHFREMDEIRFPDSQASRFIMENRR